MTTPSLPARKREGMGRQIAASGFWAMIGFIGVSVLAGQFVQIGNGAAVDESLGLALAGAALAAYAWHRARLALRSAAKPAAQASAALWIPEPVQASVAPHR